jgi:large subunit ribosomal protein L21
MFAVIASGGKQVLVQENAVIKVEKLEGAVGDVITFNQVLAIGSTGERKVGSPFVAGATVEAEILKQAKDDRVIIFKKKRRHNYRRKVGHRQQITLLRVKSIKS